MPAPGGPAVEMLKPLFVAADRVRLCTPMFSRVTAPVVPLPDKPVPATIEVTPVFVIVILLAVVCTKRPGPDSEIRTSPVAPLTELTTFAPPDRVVETRSLTAFFVGITVSSDQLSLLFSISAPTQMAVVPSWIKNFLSVLLNAGSPAVSPVGPIPTTGSVVPRLNLIVAISYSLFSCFFGVFSIYV